MMTALVWLSLITMILLSMVHLQSVMCFTFTAPLQNTFPGSTSISQTHNAIQSHNVITKGQIRERSTALGVGAFGGGGMMKKSPGGFGGGSTSGGKSAFG